MAQVNAEVHLHLPRPMGMAERSLFRWGRAVQKAGAEQSSSGVLQQSGPGVQMGNTRDVNGFRSGKAFRPKVG